MDHAHGIAADGDPGNRERLSRGTGSFLAGGGGHGCAIVCLQAVVKYTVTSPNYAAQRTAAPRAAAPRLAAQRDSAHRWTSLTGGRRDGGEGESMRCPHCGSLDDRVMDSRTLANGESIRRRRECTSCGLRFTSYERIEERPLMVVKRDGRREPFERIKIERGVARALEKRPVSQLSIENLVNEIEDEAAHSGRTGNEIASSVLGDMVLRRLFALDRVAYIRFASVYRKFETLEEFLREIEHLRASLPE